MENGGPLAKPPLQTKASAPGGPTAGAGAAEPAVNGDPLAGVSTPVFTSILYPDTLFDVGFATYTNSPDGSATMEIGSAPAAKGDPATAVSAPLVESMA